MISDEGNIDAVLLNEIKEGNENAFKEIFERYNSLLYSHVHKKLNNESESRDIVQDIFISLWEKKDTLKDNNLAGYLFTCARNKVLNVIKHKNIIDKYEHHFKIFAEERSYYSVENILNKKELEEIIEAEIADLPPRMKKVFELSRKEFLSHQEIADRLGITKQTVNDHLKASLKILRTKVGIILLIILLINPSCYLVCKFIKGVSNNKHQYFQ